MPKLKELKKQALKRKQNNIVQHDEYDEDDIEPTRQVEMPEYGFKSRKIQR
jgi:hypothetical protein